METKKDKAFTLVELMVIFAAISILATIVLVHINLARNKARDIAIKGDMSSFLGLAFDYRQQHGNYGGFCNDLATESLFDSIPAYNAKKEKYCQHDSDDWMVCAQLNYPEDRSKAWCVDKSGFSKQIDSSECKQGLKTCP